MRVLVVDSYPDSAVSFADLLTVLGCASRTAEDGEQALALAETFRPHLILAGVGPLPGDGLVLIRRLRSHPGLCATPAVALVTVPRRCLEVLASGYDGFLLKPVLPEQLLQVLSRFGPVSGVGAGVPPY